MKVAIVLNTSWNIYNFRMGLIKTLKSEGHEVIAIAPEDSYSERLVAAGLEYHKVKMDSRGANPIKDMGLIFELYGIYKETKPDVILHYTIKPNIYGTLAANVLKIPVVNNVCGLGTVFMKKNFVSKVATWMYRIAFKSPKKVFFQNQFDLDLFVDQGLVDEKIGDVIPGSGIDLSKFGALPFKRNKKFTFLMISRLIHDKGVVEYIDAVRKLKSKGVEAKFQVLGPKDEKHSRGIKTDIIDGWIDNNIIEYLGTTDDVQKFIDKADCVVLPSYREGTPRTLLEAASSSKPIVATDVPGCRNVVENEFNGLLCELKNSDDLAQKMHQMMSLSDEEIKKYGQNGRKKVETEFNEHLVFDKYVECISQLND